MKPYSADSPYIATAVDRLANAQDDANATQITDQSPVMSADPRTLKFQTVHLS